MYFFFREKINLNLTFAVSVVLYAPINVKPLGEGGEEARERQGFDVTSVPAVGTFDHLPSRRAFLTTYVY